MKTPALTLLLLPALALGVLACGGGGDEGGTPIAIPDALPPPPDVSDEPCVPEGATCLGNNLQICDADGGLVSLQNCAEAEMVCMDGACRTGFFSCATITPIETRLGQPTPASIASAFAVDTCAGSPVVGLEAASLRILEDGKPVDHEIAQPMLLETGTTSYVTLVVDHAPWLKEAGMMDAIAQAAIGFVNTVMDAHEVASLSMTIAFMGQGYYVQVPFTSDRDALVAALSALPTDAKGSNATDLHGAVVQALQATKAVKAIQHLKSAGGVLAIGQVVVFTGSSDKVDSTLIEDVQSALADSPDDLVLVSVDGGLEAAEGAELGANATYVAQDTDDLSYAFSQAADRVLALQRRVYLLGYCSPQVAGNHTLEIGIDSVSGTSPSFPFSATGFDGEEACNPQHFADACASQDCGGMFCGGCPSGRWCVDDGRCLCAGYACSTDTGITRSVLAGEGACSNVQDAVFFASGGYGDLALACSYEELGDPQCTDDCPLEFLVNDGNCDDGRPGAETSYCLLGTDCTDCGPAYVTFGGAPVSFHLYHACMLAGLAEAGVTGSCSDCYGDHYACLSEVCACLDPEDAACADCAEDSCAPELEGCAGDTDALGGVPVTEQCGACPEGEGCYAQVEAAGYGCEVACSVEDIACGAVSYWPGVGSVFDTVTGPCGTCDEGGWCDGNGQCEDVCGQLVCGFDHQEKDVLCGTCPGAQVCATDQLSCHCANPLLEGEGCDVCVDSAQVPPACGACADPAFTGPDCDQCVDPAKTGPSCEACVDLAKTGPGCDVCVDPKKTGAACGACKPAFEGPECATCADPTMKGELCDQPIWPSVLVTFTLAGDGDAPNESSWAVSSATSAVYGPKKYDPQVIIVTLELEPGLYSVHVTDTYGDAGLGVTVTACQSTLAFIPMSGWEEPHATVSSFSVPGGCLGGPGGDGIVGSACEADDDCAIPDGWCQTDWPNGYCFADCGPGQPCPAGSSCLAEYGYPYCYAVCVSDGDCRAAEGYDCLDLSVLGASGSVCHDAP